MNSHELEEETDATYYGEEHYQREHQDLLDEDFVLQVLHFIGGFVNEHLQFFVVEEKLEQLLPLLHQVMICKLHLEASLCSQLHDLGKLVVRLLDRL